MLLALEKLYDHTAQKIGLSSSDNKSKKQSLMVAVCKVVLNFVSYQVFTGMQFQLYIHNAYRVEIEVGS